MRLPRGLTLLVLSGSLGLSALGQVTSGSVTGVVYDSSNQPIPSAQVEAKDLGRAVIRTVSADSNGFYRIPDLLPSRYELTAVADKFSPSTPRDVRLEVDSTLRVDFFLAVRGMEQSVTV